MSIKTITMDVDDFIKVPANPVQRDTKHHAKKAKKSHLSEYSETHKKVSIAKWVGGQCKLDGHTRSLLWEAGELKAPSSVSADIYKVKDKNEAIKLYEHFDNKTAAESTADQVSGILKFLKIKGYSNKHIRGCGIYSACDLINQAMKRAEDRTAIQETITPYKKEIQALADQCWNANVQSNKPGVPGCVTVAFIVTMRVYGQECLGFWEGYYSGEGTNHLKSGRDGSKAAADFVKKRRDDGNLMGRENTTRCAEALINAYIAYRKKLSIGRITELYVRDYNNSAAGQFGDLLRSIKFN